MTKKISEKSELAVVPCRDHQSRTCIQVMRGNEFVKFIPLNVTLGLQIQEMEVTEFDQLYQPMVNYPAERACKLYLEYSLTIGASKEVLDHLSQIINVSKQECEMAIAKQQKTISQLEDKRAAKKQNKVVSSTTSEVAEPAETKSVLPQAKAKAKVKGSSVKEPTTKMPSAAQRFKDLIMGGGLTDNQIFEKVQIEFGLDEKKRGYVKWYRNHLKKSGLVPPAVQEEKS